MYTNSKCAVKMCKKHTHFLSTGLWVEPGMQLEPHPLQHAYQRIGEGTRTVCSNWPLKSNVYCLLMICPKNSPVARTTQKTIHTLTLSSGSLCNNGRAKNPLASGVNMPFLKLLYYNIKKYMICMDI